MKFEEVLYTQKAYHHKPTFLPTRATAKSAGHDFFLKEDVTIQPGKAVFQYTDVKCRLNRDEVLLLFVRSSIGIKQHLMLANGTGVIDADYYGNADNDGNIGLTLYNYGSETVELKAGERIMQGVVVDYKITENDGAFGSRVGGFGSTGV